MYLLTLASAVASDVSVAFDVGIVRGTLEESLEAFRESFSAFEGFVSLEAFVSFEEFVSFEGFALFEESLAGVAAFEELFVLFEELSTAF